MKTDKLLHLIQQKKFMRSGGALPLPKHQLVGPVSSQLINQALGQNNTSNNVRDNVTVAPKNLQAQSTTKDIATYGSVEKAAQAKAARQAQAAQSQSKIYTNKPGYGNYEYYNPAQGEKRDDTKIAPEGSVRATVQNALNTANEAVENQYSNPFMNPAGKFLYDTFVGAPAQSAINLSNTAMGDRPIRGDKDFLNFGFDVANVAPFVGAAAKGGKRFINAFDQAGRMAFGVNPEMGILPKSFSNLFKKSAPAAEASGYSFKAPSNFHYDDAGAFYTDAYKDLKALRERGANWDKIASDQGKTFNATNILHPEAIQYHGTYSGRPIVEVKMPDGTSEYFYKSTGWAGKSGAGVNGTTNGQWQVYGGKHLSGQGSPTSNWFLKDEGYKDYYGSKFFGDIANTMDDALLRKLNLNSIDELDNAVNFQNRNGRIDTFTPKKEDGGSLPKHQGITSQVLSQPGPTKAKADFINSSSLGMATQNAGNILNQIMSNKKNQPFVNFIDTRTNDPVVPGKKLEATRKHHVKGVSREELMKMVNQARKLNTDPSTAITTALWETNMGQTDRNLVHDLYQVSPTEEGLEGFDAQADMAMQAINRQLKLGKKKYPEGPFYKQMQAFQGYGNLYPNTEEDYYGHANQAFFGIPVTRQNPLRTNVLFPYGKTIENFRDSVVIPTLDQYGIKYKKEGGELTNQKAAEMLYDGTANGKPLTAKQERYFKYIANKK